MSGEIRSSFVFVVRLIVCQSNIYRVVGNLAKKSDYHRMYQGTFLQDGLSARVTAGRVPLRIL